MQVFIFAKLWETVNQKMELYIVSLVLRLMFSFITFIYVDQILEYTIVCFF